MFKHEPGWRCRLRTAFSWGGMPDGSFLANGQSVELVGVPDLRRQPIDCLHGSVCPETRNLPAFI